MTVRFAMLGFLAAAALTACAQQPATTASAPAPAPPPPVPFAQAVLAAGTGVLGDTAAAGGRTLVIDPLVNGVTGEQTAATRSIGSQLADVARQKYPQLDVRPFDAAVVASAPVVLVGTFTPVNAQNQPSGAREAFRFCLVAADLKSGRIAAKRAVRATPEGIDSTPTRMFADSPAWTRDPGMQSYISTCQATKVGDPIPAEYLNGILTAAMVSQAMDAYDAGRYREALDLFESARNSPAGDQLRVYNGVYLTQAKLNAPQRTEAFGNLVDYGLRHDDLAVKFLFRPATTAFIGDPAVSGAYPMWLQQIADHSTARGACLQVTGHTDSAGSAALNDRLSALRAEYVRTRLQTDNAALANHVIATGAGASQPLVGTGAGDASDALDRRVDFKVIPAC